MMRITTLSLVVAALLLTSVGCDTVYFTGEPPQIAGVTPEGQFSLSGCEHAVVYLGESAALEEGADTDGMTVVYIDGEPHEVTIDMDDMGECSAPVVTFGSRNAAVLESYNDDGDVQVRGQDKTDWEVACHLRDGIDLAPNAINVISPPGPVSGGTVHVQVACEGGVDLMEDAFAYPDGRMTDGPEVRDLHEDEVSGLAILWSDGPFVNVPFAYGYGFVHESPVPRQSIFLAGDHDAVATGPGIRPQTPPAAFELPEGSDRLRIGDAIELYRVRNHTGVDGPTGGRVCDEPICNYVGDPTDFQNTDAAFLRVEYERPAGQACFAGAYGRDEITGDPNPDEDTCSDGIDNDENGNIDSNDISCGYYWGSGDDSDDAPTGCVRWYHIDANLAMGLTHDGFDLAPNELPLDFTWQGVMRPLGSPPYETRAQSEDLDENLAGVGIELPTTAYRARLVRTVTSFGLPMDPDDPFEHELEFFDALELEEGTTEVMLPEETVFPFYFDPDVRYYENFDTGGENVVPMGKPLFVRANGGTSYGTQVDAFDTDGNGNGVADPWEYVITIPDTEEGDPNAGTGFAWALDLYYSFPMHIDPNDYEGETMSASDWERFDDEGVITACKGLPILWEDECGEREGDRDSCFDGEDNDGDDLTDDADSDCFCKDDFVTASIDVYEPALPMSLGWVSSYRLVAHAWHHQERLCLPPEALAALPDISPSIGIDEDYQSTEVYRTSGWGIIAFNKHRMSPVPINELHGNMIADAQHGYQSYFFTVSNCQDGIDNDADGAVDCDDWACADAIVCGGQNPENFWEAVQEPLCSDGRDNDEDGWVDYVEDNPLTEDIDESLWGDPGCDDSEDQDEENEDLGPCADGMDNDGDGDVDGYDEQCADPTTGGWDAVSENPQCSNTVDDDGDGFTDYPDDPDCVDENDNIEATTGCENGLDDDGDGWVDWDDPDCYYWGFTSEDDLNVASWVCANGQDDDLDGLIDGNDPGCSDAEDTSEEDPHASCSDGADNDGDGWIDMEDPTCVDDIPEVTGGGTETECHNGLDDDGDGDIDGFDAQCDDAYDPTEAAGECEDLTDNDGDGWIDMDDPDCYYWLAGAEMGLDVSSWVCADGVDNDSDGVIDGNDPGCDSAEDTDETDPHWSCIDGADNDGDGWIDEDDPDCDNNGDEDAGGYGATECNDGSDNDGDGFIDADDPECTDATIDQEAGPNCADGVDNDGDGWIDADDPDCYFYGSDFENGATIAAQCGNGVDDDGDFLIDGNDPGCDDAEDADESDA